MVSYNQVEIIRVRIEIQDSLRASAKSFKKEGSKSMAIVAVLASFSASVEFPAKNEHTQQKGRSEHDGRLTIADTPRITSTSYMY